MRQSQCDHHKVKMIDVFGPMRTHDILKGNDRFAPMPVIPGRPSQSPMPPFVRTHRTDCFRERRFRCKNVEGDDTWSRRRELK
jgi:hypothetical protein